MQPSLRVTLLIAAVFALILASTLLLIAYKRGAPQLQFSRTSIATGTFLAASVPAAEAIYLNPELGLVLRYPSSWSAETGGAMIGKLPTRFRGADGFFELAITGEPGLTLGLAVNDVAYSEEQPYGANPEISVITIGGQEGRLITATDPQITDVALLVPFPQPITINNQPGIFLVLHTDRSHLGTLAAQFRFIENHGGEIIGIPDIIVYEPRSNDAIKGTVSVIGVARVFPASPAVRPVRSAGEENTVTFRLVDPYTNRMLFEQTAVTTAPNAGTYGSFVIDLNLPRIENLRSAMLKVFPASLAGPLRDGTSLDVVTIPLRFVP